jgi:1-deoxy-D-xylulose-5-phosphate reductoisomerase
MTRSITVLGSTGSVGRQTLDVIKAHPEKFKIKALTAGNNVNLLLEQAKAFAPDYIACTDLRQISGYKTCTIAEAAEMDSDITMAAIVGCAGLAPTMAAIARGKTVAFASKECLVAAGHLMMDAVKKSGATFLPVDSEHNAIYQVLQGPVRRIVLTASGGPFREWTADKMKRASVEEAIAHPTWSMGPKISVDSATLMNKALEVIEAHYLFGLPPEKIDVILHSQSCVHGMVEYEDGSFLAQMGPPDMRTPITVCLGWPERIATPGARMDLSKLSRLDFADIDTSRFPAMRLVRDVLKEGQAASIIFNAANEIAVEAFLQRRIGFTDIIHTVEEMLNLCHKPAIKTLDDVMACNENVRQDTLNRLKKAA